GSITAFLDDPDAYVRTLAVQSLAGLPEAARLAAVPVLERLLSDPIHVDVGIEEPYWQAGRLYHWRRQRRSPRAAAVQVLLSAVGLPMDGQLLLEIMLAEAVEARLLCGMTAVPQRFTLEEWRVAAEAAGGFAAVEPRMRSVQQRCQAAASPVARPC